MKKNIAKQTVSNESRQVSDQSIIPATKAAEKALGSVTKPSEDILRMRTQKPLQSSIPKTSVEKPASLSPEEKYTKKQVRYTNNRTSKAKKLQAKKDTFISRIIEENKLNSEFTKEMAEAMWYNKHDAKNRAIGGYTQKTYDAVNKAWKKNDKLEWSLVATKAKETLAKLREERTVTETVVAANGNSYTRKRVLKPVFIKKENTWSIEDAKKRFEEREAARKVRLENLPLLPIEKPLKPKKAKMEKIVDKDVKELKLTVRRQSSDKPDEYYDFKTDPFKGTLDEAIVKAKEIANSYIKDTSFESVVIKELDADKKLIPLKVIKKDELKAAA